VRPRLLDLFGGEGLAALGYARAGFEVTSVENDPERIANHVRHPHVTVEEGDATTWPLDGYDVVHASPPCTDHSTLSYVATPVRGGDSGTGWMLTHTLERLVAWCAETGGYWIVENVEGAKATMLNPVKLCGSMFGLEDEGWLLRRHRYFDSNAALMAPGPCRCHRRKIIGVYGDLTPNDRQCAGRRLNRPNGDTRAGVERARRLMGAPPETSPRGLTLGLPIEYTRFLGEQLMAHLQAVAA